MVLILQCGFCTIDCEITILECYKPKICLVSNLDKKTFQRKVLKREIISHRSEAHSEQRGDEEETVSHY